MSTKYFAQIYEEQIGMTQVSVKLSTGDKFSANVTHATEYGLFLEVPPNRDPWSATPNHVTNLFVPWAGLAYVWRTEK